VDLAQKFHRWSATAEDHVRCVRASDAEHVPELFAAEIVAGNPFGDRLHHEGLKNTLTTQLNQRGRPMPVYEVVVAGAKPRLIKAKNINGARKHAATAILITRPTGERTHALSSRGVKLEYAEGSEPTEGQEEES
jgi:hypothetical protein